jgi:hypothetical protein
MTVVKDFIESGPPPAFYCEKEASNENKWRSFIQHTLASAGATWAGHTWLEVALVECNDEAVCICFYEDGKAKQAQSYERTHGRTRIVIGNMASVAKVCLRMFENGHGKLTPWWMNEVFGEHNEPSQATTAEEVTQRLPDAQATQAASK